MIHAAYRRDGPDAWSTIVEGSANVATAAAAIGARFVHVSTDIVFGGSPSHYEEADPPSPVEPYGRAKAAAEAEVAARCPDAVIARPSLLYGDERPSPVQQAVLDAIDGTHPLRFFTDEVRCPSHVTDVAAALVTLCERPEITGPLHLGGPDALEPLRVRLPRGGLGRPPARARPPCPPGRPGRAEARPRRARQPASRPVGPDDPIAARGARGSLIGETAAVTIRAGGRHQGDLAMAAPLLIRDGTLIDGTGAPARPGSSVLLQRRRDRRGRPDRRGGRHPPARRAPRRHRRGRGDDPPRPHRRPLPRHPRGTGQQRRAVLPPRAGLQRHPRRLAGAEDAPGRGHGLPRRRRPLRDRSRPPRRHRLRHRRRAAHDDRPARPPHRGRRYRRSHDPRGRNGGLRRRWSATGTRWSR